MLKVATHSGQDRGAAQGFRVRKRVRLNAPIERLGHMVLTWHTQMGSTASGWLSSTFLHSYIGAHIGSQLHAVVQSKQGLLARGKSCVVCAHTCSTTMRAFAQPQAHTHHQSSSADGFVVVGCLGSRCRPSSCPLDSPLRFHAQSLPVRVWRPAQPSRRQDAGTRSTAPIAHEHAQPHLGSRAL